MTVKFPSVEEGKKWLEVYRSFVPLPPPQTDELVFEEEEDDGELYEALDDVLEQSGSYGGMSKSVSFASQSEVGSSMGKSESRISTPGTESRISTPGTESRISNEALDKVDTSSPSCVIKVRAYCIIKTSSTL